MMSYAFRIPTCANIAYGNKESWLNDWHSLDMLLSMELSMGFVWIEHDVLSTLLSDIALYLRDLGLRYDGFDWE